MINRIIRAIAGTFVLISLLLAIYVNHNWLWLTAFVWGQPASVFHHKMVPHGRYFEKTRHTRPRVVITK